MLSVGIKYSVRDLLCDVISNAWPAKSDRLCITYGKWCHHSLRHRLALAFLGHLLDGDLCKYLSYFNIPLFLVFNHNFIIYIDFPRMANVSVIVCVQRSAATQRSTDAWYSSGSFTAIRIGRLRQLQLHHHSTGCIASLSAFSSVFLLPLHHCGLGAGSIPFRAIVNNKQCEMRGLLMSLVIQYWIEDVQDSQGLIHLRNDLYCVRWGVNSTHSLTHSLTPVKDRLPNHWATPPFVSLFKLVYWT